MTSSLPFVPSMNVAKKKTGRKRQLRTRNRAQAQVRCDVLSVGSFLPLSWLQQVHAHGRRSVGNASFCRLEASTFDSRRVRRHPFGNAFDHPLQFFELFVDGVESFRSEERR